jgi:hypothetical protein
MKEILRGSSRKVDEIGSGRKSRATIQQGVFHSYRWITMTAQRVTTNETRSIAASRRSII